jgi:hypothetical protein
MTVVRAAVVGRADSDFDALIAEALRRAGGRPVELTVVAVARRALVGFAPRSGQVTLTRLLGPPRACCGSPTLPAR